MQQRIQRSYARQGSALIPFSKGRRDEHRNAYHRCERQFRLCQDTAKNTCREDQSSKGFHRLYRSKDRL